MTPEITATLTWAATYFAAAKLFFGFLGWFSQENGDRLYRAKLDHVWDRLHRMSPFDVVHRALARIARKVSGLLRMRRGLVGMALFIVGINSVCVAFAFHLLGLQISRAPCKFMALLLVTLLIPMIVDVASLRITLALIRRAGASLSWARTLVHVVIDVVAAYVFIILCSVAFTLAVMTVEPGWQELATEAQKEYLAKQDLDEVQRAIGSLQAFFAPEVAVDVLIVVGMLVGGSAALPTLLYLLVLISLVLLRAIPRWWESRIRHAIYLVTIDKRPVLSQLGTLFGGGAAAVKVLADLAGG